LQEWECLECHAVLFDEVGAPREPCPKCGAIRRAAIETLEDVVLVLDGMRMVGKRAGRARPLFEARTGASYFRSGQEWHHVERLVDRENDRYVEKITRISTGEVVRHVDEPLSEHIGHGSDKRRSDHGSR
jgi:hypothetical protein